MPKSTSKSKTQPKAPAAAKVTPEPVKPAKKPAAKKSGETPIHSSTMTKGTKKARVAVKKASKPSVREAGQSPIGPGIAKVIKPKDSPISVFTKKPKPEPMAAQPKEGPPDGPIHGSTFAPDGKVSD